MSAERVGDEEEIVKWFRRCLLPYISASATPNPAVVRSRLPRDGALRLRAARVSPAQGPECLGLLRAHPRTPSSTLAPHLSPPRAPSGRKEPADAPLYPLSSTFASDSGAGWPASTCTSIAGDVPEAMTAQSPDLAVVEHASDTLFSWTALLFASACPQGCPFSLYARVCRPHESMQHI